MTAMDGREDEGAAAPVTKALEYPCGDPPEPGRIREVAPGVHWVRMPLPFALKWINLWLIEDGEGFVLVDTGVGTEPTRQYWRTIFEKELKGRPITRVICTHMHPDHIGLAGWITRKHKCPLWMSRLEYMTCRVLVADTGREAPDEGLEFYREAGWDDDALDSYRVRFGGFGKMVSRLPDGFKRLTDGDTIDIGGRPWRVICGSGHSPEHVCLWQKDINVFISGDQVLPRITSNVSVFPTEPDADPLTDWLESCAKVAREVSGAPLVLPAHNEPFFGLHTRLEALITSHERMLTRLEKRLAEGEKRVPDLFGALFARPIDLDVLNMATGETVAHLNCLLGRGKIVKRMREDGVALYTAR